MGALNHWLDISHLVVRTRLAVTVLNRLVLADEGLVRIATGYTKELKIVVRQDHAVLVGAEAQCKKCRPRHYVAQQGTAMLNPLFEKPAQEPSQADIDRDIEGRVSGAN